MEATIEVTDLRKRFGQTVALDGMSFTVRPGRITGLVGPRGAGKSITLRAILGMDAVDHGTALIEGRPYRSLRHPLSTVGALLNASALQPGRSARNHLLWLARAQGLGSRRVDEVVEVVGLERAAARRRADDLAAGMRHRLGVAAALLGDPPILMMDEPLKALDADDAAWMRGFLTSLARQGRAVLVTSSLMSELQDTADHLVVVRHGTVVADTGVPDLLRAASDGRTTLRTSARIEVTTALAHAGATVTVTGPDTITVSGLEPDRIVAVLRESAAPYSDLARHRATLEEAFMELTRDAAEFRATR